MATPNTQQKRQAAMPTWHPGNRQWCQKIGYKHTRSGTRDRAWHYWPGEEAATPPAGVIAAAYAKVQEWKELVANWDSLRPQLEEMYPDDDWTMPVWVNLDATAWPLTAGQEIKAARAVEAEYRTKEATAELATVASFGSREAIIRELKAANVLPSNFAAPARNVTIREAIAEYLTDQQKRMAMKVGSRIDTQTFNTARCNLLLCLGLSTSKEQELKGQTSPLIGLDKPIYQLSNADLKTIAEHFFTLPGNISRRTVRNYFGGLSQFMNWCELQEDYGFLKPRAARKTLQIQLNGTDRHVEEPNLAQLRTILKGSSEQVRIYAMLGLLCGFYQTDICELQASEVEQRKGETYITGYRSKEDAEAKAHSKIKTTHWIPAEVAELMAQHRAKANAHGLYFLNRAGNPMSSVQVAGGRVNAVAEQWHRSCKKAGQKLQFKQLRKWGWNLIQRYSVDPACSGETLAARWAGQEGGGVSGAYRFADYLPVIEAQRKLWKDVQKALKM